MQIIGAILLVGLGGFFFYSLWKGKNKPNDDKKKTKKKESETVQDLLDYDYISDKGIVKLKSGTYTATLELTQINQHLNNVSENAAIWKKWRTMLNSVSIRETLLVQSQYLDVNDFVNDYNSQSQALQNLTPELKEARDDIIDNYKEFAEQKTREYRAYIIFRFNPRKDGMEKGMETGSTALNNMLAAVKGQVNEMDEEEERDLAESILEEVIDLSYQMLHSIGSKAYRLNRSGVLSMTYSTLNRDLAMTQRIHDASDAHSFSELKQSLSPYYFEEQLRSESERYQSTDFKNTDMDTLVEPVVFEETLNEKVNTEVEKFQLQN
jgi:flagellar biosynthesis/type III secretory pathway protein FliH